MSDEPTGPNPETLRRLAEMMPSFIKGMESGQTAGKGRKISIPQQTRPTKLCPVCMKTWDLHAVPPDTQLSPVVCEDCEAQLKKGLIALVSGDEYAFVSPIGIIGMEDLAGTIVRISPQNMAEVRKKFEAHLKKQG